MKSLEDLESAKAIQAPAHSVLGGVVSTFLGAPGHLNKEQVLHPLLFGAAQVPMAALKVSTKSAQLF